MPLIDLQKTNTVALVESFLGEFKPDNENNQEPVTPDKSNATIVENTKEPVKSQPSKEVLINESTKPIKQENEISNEMKLIQSISSDVCLENESVKITKPFVEESIAPPVEQKPPPPPVKRKVKLYS